MTQISLKDFHRLLASAVAKSINEDGCDLYLCVAREDASRWALVSEAHGEIDTYPDPVTLLHRYLEKP